MTNGVGGAGPKGPEGLFPPIDSGELREIGERLLNQIRTLNPDDVPGGQQGAGPARGPVLVAPKQDAESLALVLLKLRSESGEVQLSCGKAEILDNMEQNKLKNQEKLTKLKEAMDQMEQARAAQQSKKIWGWIGSAVGFIGAVIAAAVTTTLAVAAWAASPTGVAAVAAVGLTATAIGAWTGVAAAGIGLGKMIMDETGGTQALCDAMGWKVDDFSKVMNGIVLGLTIASAVMQIGGVIITGGATLYAGAGAFIFGLGEGVKSGASVATIVACSAKFAYGVMKETLGLLSKVNWVDFFVRLGVIAGGAAQIVAGGAKVTEGALAIETARLVRESEMSQAEALDFDAIMKKLAGAMEDEMERIQELIQQLEENVTRVMDMFKEGTDSKEQIIKQMI